MTDGAMLTEILAALEIPCDKCSFHGKLDALAAGLGIATEGRLLGDVLDDIAAKEGIQRDNRLYGAFIRKLYDYVTNGEDVTLTGNPLVLANSMGKPLKECVVSWEPVQEGSGTPSPENIRPIKGRDSVMVERCGENLLDISQCTPTSPSGAYGLTITVDDTGLIKLSGIPKVKKEMAIAPYRVLFTNQVISVENYKAKAFVVKGTVTEIRTIASDKSIVIVTPLAPDTPVDIQFRIMYYVGDVPATYTPYTGSTTTITLPSTIYGGEVVVTGAGAAKIKVITVDGERIKFSGKGDYWNLPMYSTEGIENTGSIIACSHFEKNKLAVNTAYSFIFTQPNQMTDLFASADELSAYCAAQYAAGTPVQIAYKLATPIPFTATGGGTIPTIKGTNTLLTDADTIKATYRCNVRAAEQEINALYTDLLNELEE